MSEVAKSVLDGTDLIFSVGGKALGFSTGCKVSTSVETGERITKEASSGKWKEKYVKSFSESISADGCVLTDGDAETPTYDQLKELMLKGDPVDAAYSLRDGDKRTGKTTAVTLASISLPLWILTVRRAMTPSTASSWRTRARSRRWTAATA